MIFDGIFMDISHLWCQIRHWGSDWFSHLMWMINPVFGTRRTCYCCWRNMWTAHNNINLCTVSSLSSSYTGYSCWLHVRPWQRRVRGWPPPLEFSRGRAHLWRRLRPQRRQPWGLRGGRWGRSLQILWWFPRNYVDTFIRQTRPLGGAVAGARRGAGRAWNQPLRRFQNSKKGP